MLSGTLSDPYTAAAIDFLRGNDTSAAVQIDHVVALSDAWQKGAQQLSAAARSPCQRSPQPAGRRRPRQPDEERRRRRHLAAAEQGLPLHYVARQISVKAAYGLWVTPAEKEAMKRILASCPEQQTIVPQPVR